MKPTKGKWINGYGKGITGPTTPTVGGPTVRESLEYSTWLDNDMKGKGPVNKHAVVSCNGQTIAIVPTYYPEGKANARLIAAAPDLVAACEEARIAINQALVTIREVLNQNMEYDVGGRRKKLPIERTLEAAAVKLETTITKAKKGD